MTGIIILICAILAGFLLGRYLQKRVKYKNDLYTDLVKYVGALRLNVGGAQIELAQFNNDFCSSASKTFCECLTTGKCSVLKSEQKKQVSDFFVRLKDSGREQILQHLDLYEGIFRDELQTSMAEVKKSSFYVKIGLLLGVMVGILFL